MRNPIIPVEKPNVQPEPVQPRASVFSKMVAISSSSPADKKVPVCECFSAFLVHRFEGEAVTSTAEAVQTPNKSKLALNVARSEFKKSSTSIEKQIMRPQ